MDEQPQSEGKAPKRGKQIGFGRIQHGGEEFRRIVHQSRNGKHWVIILDEPWQVKEINGTTWRTWRRLV